MSHKLPVARPPQPLDADQLRQEHEHLDARLQQLDKLRSLSPEEQYEKMVIKKRKLAIKDKLSSLLSS